MAFATLGPRYRGGSEDGRASGAGQPAFHSAVRRRNVVVIAGSAGAVSAICRVVADLPGHLPAAVFVVIHVPPRRRSALPHILSGAGPLPVKHARNGDPIALGRILVAPPDWHMLVGRERVHLDHGAAEHGNRPSADVLFRSAARHHGDRVIGVVLTGVLDDGASGMAAIVQRGGVGIVQDPLEAEFSGMPANAIDIGAPQHVVKVDEIAEMIVTALEFTLAAPRRVRPPRQPADDVRLTG